jgi:hypothetical protein
MKNIWRSFRATWGRPKRHGITGNFSTVVIITGIIIGGWIMTGGEYPEVVPTYYGTPIYAVLLADQPQHEKHSSMSFTQLRLKELPTPTPLPIECKGESIAFLIDLSGSMLLDTGGGTKIAKVQNGLKQFTEALSDDAALAIYSFSEPFDGKIVNPDEPGPEPDVPEPRERLFMTRYGDVKGDVPGIIDALEPYPFAATYMRDAFQHAQNWLRLEKSEFPNNEQTLIFISDGVPETDERGPNDNCFQGQERCYSPAEDPTIPTNIGQSIQNDGVDIYSVAIYTDEDAVIYDKLKSVLQGVASKPSLAYYKESVGADSISEILTSIRNEACKS